MCSGVTGSSWEKIRLLLIRKIGGFPILTWMSVARSLTHSWATSFKVIMFPLPVPARLRAS
ncbi:MAG: hypothetical protein BWY73_01128 [candidate division TA06 bacterium ADurb.Bin417]|uniref:Uncharacterized protein n=1 Tax=candidate division TA06 bacterium ADurb.Bin417 TaxID=1852828 RepID=A0A1V5MDI9_UNCT6|nr:MAG: hypothetical protein BWY73_01128 [candidate division TA06 bacterium ADurb.Bin417]